MKNLLSYLFRNSDGQIKGKMVGRLYRIIYYVGESSKIGYGTYTNTKSSKISSEIICLLQTSQTWNYIQIDIYIIVAVRAVTESNQIRKSNME